MIKVIIFGGTTEGRELAQFCVRYQVPALVCVASEYGGRLLPDHPCLNIHTGKLDEAGMISLIETHHPKFIIDATHPYARIVSETVRNTCGKLGIPCHRILRDSETGQANSVNSDSRMITVADTAAAIDFLRTTTGNIFLTTGSKTLGDFMELPDSRERIYARVLPDSQVIADCEQLGIKGRHLIGIQGPFSREINQAMLEQTKAAWMVTKESGDAGGFTEKTEAAWRCGVSVIVIGRPVKEQGISIAEAKKILLPYGTVPQRQLHLIGMGMGKGRQLTVEALDAIKECQVFLGAKRMLEDISAWTGGKPAEAIYQGGAVLDWLKEHPEYDSVGVIYSGDTGFYSGSHALIQAVRSAPDLAGAVRLHVYPGISTVACLCARLHTSWEDVALASIHGRSVSITELLARHRRVFLLLGGKDPLQTLCRTLTGNGFADVRMAVGERLGYPEERILTGTPDQLIDVATDTLIAVLLERDGKERSNDEG
ncbi:MAG: precorrin-6A reductase [Lachnospiraceae bacterium]